MLTLILIFSVFLIIFYSNIYNLISRSSICNLVSYYNMDWIKHFIIDVYTDKHVDNYIMFLNNGLSYLVDVDLSIGIKINDISTNISCYYSKGCFICVLDHNTDNYYKLYYGNLSTYITNNSIDNMENVFIYNFMKYETYNKLIRIEKINSTDRYFIDLNVCSTVLDITHFKNNKPHCRKIVDIVKKETRYIKD